MVYLEELSASARTDLDNSILVKLQAGRSTRDVGNELQVSQSHVARLRRKRLSDIPTSSSGRPQALTNTQKRACIRAVTSGGFETTTQATKYVREECQVTVSVDTVRRVLRAAGLKSKVKQKKPKLNERHIKDRLEFARRHEHWTIDDWKHVIFSDETKVNRFCSDGRSWCWIRDEQSCDLRQVKQTVKFGGGSIMLWDCMTFQGSGMFCRIEGRMDQHQYKEILQRDLMYTVMAYDLDPSKLIFQHDNDPKHTAKSVSQWLKLQKFDVLKWPAQSPDLNPIEHLWAGLKRRLNQYESAPKGILELWERIEECWASIELEECKKLYESMPRRIQALLAAKGKWTKY
jgi:transposase